MDASAPPPDRILQSTQTSSLQRVTFASLSRISLGHFSVNTLKACGLISTENALMKRIQKNCAECTRTHRHCVFELVDDVKCTCCNKFCLCCMFRVSGMFTFFIILLFQIICSRLSNNIIFICFYIPEQGRRNDLNQQKVDHKTTNDHHPSSSVFVSCDSVHCNPLTQSPVSSRWSCHTTANSCEKVDVDSFVSPNIISPPPSWVHVFSKSSSTTSLRTQCAYAASMYVKSPKVS